MVCSSEGVVLLENPRGDNRLDLHKLRKISSSIFATNSTQLRFFSGGTGEITVKPLKLLQVSPRWSRAVLNLCVMHPNVIKLKNLCVVVIEEACHHVFLFHFLFMFAF